MRDAMRKLIICLAMLSGVAFAPSSTAASIESIVGGMQPGEWRELPNTRMQDVFPKEAGHPMWGVVGPRAITGAWGGGAYDTKRNILIITGGGHSDYGGNEVYEFSLKTMQWKRATEPSPMIDQGNGTFVIKGSEAPVSSHTYDGLAYMPNVDRVFKFGGSYYGNGYAYDRHVYLYDPGARTWKRGAAASMQVIEVSSGYDPKSGLVIVGTSHGLMTYDPRADSWTKLPQNDGDLAGGAGVVDPDHRLFVQALSGSGAIAYYIIEPFGDRIIAPVKGDIDWGPRPGLAYHPASKRVVLWSGGREIWSLRTDTWTAQRFSNANQPAPSEVDTWGHRKTNGIYGRWQYVPDYDVFIAYGHSTDNVWLYKLPPDKDKPKSAAKAAPCGADLCVGPGQPYTRPSEAARAAKDGQSIGIATGDYDRDVAIWQQNNLTIRGIGGRPHLRAGGYSAEDKATWVLKGNNTTIENIEFSGAAASDENGAGIRLEGAGLTVRHCIFHDNETGILTGVNPKSDVLVEYSEFARSGARSANPHNIYIGTVRSFTLRYSYVHHARVGHNVKSRAFTNFILYNRIMDELDGSSSYVLNLPNGGLSFVVGNTIQQGPRTENSTVISYGEEGLKNPRNELYLVNNTIVNDGPRDARFVFVKGGTGTVKLLNNIFAGPGRMLDGPGDAGKNLLADKADFRDAAHFDYRLRSGSRAIGAGKDPGQVDGFKLVPTSQYAHPLQAQQRDIAKGIDLGAYQYTGEP